MSEAPGYQCEGRPLNGPRCTNRTPSRHEVCRSCLQDGLEDLDDANGEPPNWWKNVVADEAGYPHGPKEDSES